MAPKKHVPERSVPFKRTSAVVGLVGAIVALTLGGWQLIDHVRDARDLRKKVAVHVSAGDRFVTQTQYNEALEEYQKAIELERTNLEAHRRIVATMRDRLLYTAFVRSGPDLGLQRFGSVGCAEAVREYHRAANRATAPDVWSTQIRQSSPESSLEIFRSYGKRTNGIPTSDLDMPLDERIGELEYLGELPSLAKQFSNLGIEDNAKFLLATLYHAVGSIEKAETLVVELLDRDRSDLRLPWLKLREKILAEGGHDARALSEIRALIREAEGPKR